MVIYTDLWDDDGGSRPQAGWDHELLIRSFSDILGAPFEREVLDRDDVWVAQSSGGLGFALHTLAGKGFPFRVALEQLDGHLASQGRVVGAVDSAKTAAAEGVQESIT